MKRRFCYLFPFILFMCTLSACGSRTALPKESETAEQAETETASETETEKTTLFEIKETESLNTEVVYEGEYEELSVEDCIISATHIVRAALKEICPDAEGRAQFLFTVSESLKGSSLEGEEILVSWQDSGNMPGPKDIGADYLMFLERNRAVFYERDIYAQFGIAYAHVDDENTAEIRNMAKAFESLNTAPEYYGNDFTLSEDINDILQVSENIVCVTVDSEGTESEFYPTVSCPCTVTKSFKGSIFDGQKLQVTFFISDEVIPGEKYLLLLPDCQASLPACTLSSRNSVYTMEKAEKIKELNALLNQ